MHRGRTTRGLAAPATLAIAIGLLTMGTARGEISNPVAAHENARCAACHGWQQAHGEVVASAVQSDRESRCRDCHAEPASGLGEGHGFHAGRSAACLDCHSFHHPERITAGPQTFTMDYGNENVRVHCRACHGPDRSLSDLDAGHREAAAAVYHRNVADLAPLTASEGCLRCHDSAGSGVPLSDPALEAPRFATHASHPYGIAFTPGQGRGDRKIRDEIDPRLPLPDGRIECQTCHQLTSGTADLLVPFADPYALCLGCHRVGDEPVGVGPLLARND